jgi:hypothetical protein
LWIHQATWRGFCSRNGQTCSSLTGRTSGLRIELCKRWPVGRVPRLSSKSASIYSKLRNREKSRPTVKPGAIEIAPTVAVRVERSGNRRQILCACALCPGGVGRRHTSSGNYPIFSTAAPGTLFEPRSKVCRTLRPLWNIDRHRRRKAALDAGCADGPNPVHMAPRSRVRVGPEGGAERHRPL